jgi:hypothetical protein
VEIRHDLHVARPRYLQLPKIGMSTGRISHARLSLPPATAIST